VPIDTSDAGLRILRGEVPFRSGYCGQTFAAATGLPSMNANRYPGYFASHPDRFRQLQVGEALQPGDYIVWQHYGSDRSTRGWRYGHIGVAGYNARTGQAVLISNFEGDRGRTVLPLANLPSNFLVYRQVASSGAARGGARRRRRGG